MNLILNTPGKRVSIESSDYTTLSELICDFCRVLGIQGYNKRDIVKELQDTIVKLEADEIISDVGEI
jgi:hypothetical protein